MLAALFFVLGLMWTIASVTEYLPPVTTHMAAVTWGIPFYISRADSRLNLDCLDVWPSSVVGLFSELQHPHFVRAYEIHLNFACPISL